jgi:hypothetical protein
MIASVQDTALNGAQVTAALDIVTRVSSGELSSVSAIAMLQNFFRLSEEEANAIIIPAVKN